MTITVTVLSIACIATVLSLFWPLLRGVPNPLIFFTNGGGGPGNKQAGTADLLIRRRVLLENLRDIQIERDFGKLSPTEYAAMAQPLFGELEAVEGRLNSRGAAASSKGVRRNRLGWFCPDCGNLNHASREAEPDLKNASCIQCGRPAQIEWDLPAGENSSKTGDVSDARSNSDANSSTGASALLLFLGGAFAVGALLLTPSAMHAQAPGQQTGGAGDRIVLQGLIANGTRGGAPATVETLELIQLGDGVMQTVQTLTNAGPRFAFAPIPRPKAPHLIRATFRGERYSTMVPPAPNFYSKPQAITIFESGADRSSVQITGAMRVTKLKAGGLAIQQYMVITNESSPPRSYDPRGYHVYIPPGAEAIRASLQHESTRVPIPLTMDAVSGKENRYRIDRGVRPGNSQLVIDYLLPDLQFADALPQEEGRSGLPPARAPRENAPGSAGPLASSPHHFRIVFWQPANARPEIEGAQAEAITIPNIGEALRVVYPGPGSAEPLVKYDFSAGGVFVENPLQSDENPLFNTGLETTVGVIAGICVLFLIASLIGGSGLRLVSGGRKS
ncbi:MAG: zinc finger Ran-binding domain-containing protein [bacterium]|nr:zinc finger Ran-binding domain-containing protein [bacterium]